MTYPCISLWSIVFCLCSKNKFPWASPILWWCQSVWNPLHGKRNPRVHGYGYNLGCHKHKFHDSKTGHHLLHNSREPRLSEWIFHFALKQKHWKHITWAAKGLERIEFLDTSSHDELFISFLVNDWISILLIKPIIMIFVIRIILIQKTWTCNAYYYTLTAIKNGSMSVSSVLFTG